MKTQSCLKCCFVLVVIFLITAKLTAQVPVITGPVSVCEGTTGNVYTAPAGMTVFNWTVSGGGTITSGVNTSTVTVTWSTAGTWQIGVTDGIALPVFLTVTVNPLPVPTITGPVDPVTLLPATLKKGVTTGQVYSTEPGMNATWTISPDGAIVSGQGTSQITVDWLTVASQQTVSVTYTDANGCAALQPTVLLINYFPFAAPIDPMSVIPFQFVDPLPHFAAGLRINAKTGGNLLVKTVPVQQVALPTGTVLANGTIGDPATPNAGKGNYAAYQISKDNGVTWGIPMWPAQTIEAQQGFPMTVQYENGLAGLTYDNFNILADQTLMMKGYQLIGDPLTQPYTGEIPMVVHLHGGEIPSNSDGGPNSWFMPNLSQLGPAFKFNASTLATYPNNQEAATLWFHPHDDGLTRINVYTGLAGFYFLRGADEESAMVPGWSGDDLVREVTPAGKSATFNGTNAYLPEIEIAIQDRMFDVNGQLYWPVAPPNPEIHPFWTPEFIGDIFTVNGKAWPYLSVAPRKYRFRLLDGCHARWLNMWLANAADGTPGPKITVIGGEGGLLATPVDVDPALGKTITIGPGQRYDIIIDFTGIPAGTTFTLMNDAGAPFPFGDPVVPGLTDRIMQFVVNGQLVSAADPAIAGTDKSQIPVNLRPVNPLVKLTDFAGGVTPGVIPDVKRQIILNEVMGIGGPAAVLVNNTYFDTELAIAGTPIQQGGPTEFMQEGTTEIVQIANVSADAHPIHIHLLQWQLVSRQAIDDVGYLQAYTTAWNGAAEFPAGMGYPGGAGSPFPYETINADGAVGGNPELSPFLLGPVMPALPEEMGWKDNVTVLPGQVTTFIVRVAPTDRPINAPQDQLLFPFDPSLGPGYVWHCHVIDHEDMSMMRPLIIKPSPLRLPQISAQPASVTACAGDIVTYSVTATSMTPLKYQWQVSTDAGTTWTNLVDGAPYAGTLSSTLSISPSSAALTGSYYKCVLTNTTGFTESTAGLLTVNNCFVSGTLKYNNATLDPLAGFTVTINGLSAVTDASGAFTIPGITSGIYPVLVTTLMPTGSINSTDAGTVNSWVLLPAPIPNVKYESGDVNNDLLLTAVDAMAIQNNFVSAKLFLKGPWVFNKAGLSGIVNPPALSVAVSGAPVANFDILGMCTGDFNGSFNPASPAGSSNVLLTNTGNVLLVAPGKQFDLALISVNGGQFGAVSLVLTVPSNLVTIKNVKITGSTGAVTTNMVGNELRIGWNSTLPVTIPAGGVLATITFAPTPAFTSIQTLRVGIVPSGLNELADGLFNPVLNAELTVDDVKVTADAVLGATIKLTAYPNPATSTTTISYQIPVAGNVTLGVYNANGTPALMPLFVDNIAMIAGSYSLNADVSALMPGTYYITIKLVSGTKISTKTLKFIKN